ncbi:MAG TPA: glycoside hydrolase family 6 protein [Candidatus Limnocylindrales bacterium]|nr:glycoside hydrolase family 6 protein [Candidatus Limnocylindrales bacterium]
MNQRKLIASVAGSILVLSGVAVLQSSASAATSCEATATFQPWTESPGTGGYTANLTVRNTGDPITSWTVTSTLPSGQGFTQGWSANWTFSGGVVTATPLDWNRNLGTGVSTSIGYNGRWTNSFVAPTYTCTPGGGGPVNQLPNVTLTSPTAGQNFAAGTPVPLAATASDPDGTIANVAFLIDGVVVNTDTTSPYSFSATNLTAGNHTAAARATDNSGGIRETPPVQFSVGGGGTPSVVFNPVSTTVAEGGSQVVTVRLSSNPTANVTVSLVRTGDTNITVSPTSVAFTTTNGTVPVNVTVSAAQDADNLNGTATITGSGTGVTSGSLMVTEADDEPTGPDNRVNNPFAGATGYNNPDWRARANSVSGGSRIANQPTGVWMDRIAAIAGGSGAMGLRAHLDEAVRQDAANGATALYIQVVIYNLPGRDCSALASNGELGPNDLPRYQAEYIDPIANLMGEEQYRGLRIVTIIEIDSIPNLVTNLNVAMCSTVNSNGAYINGVGYALRRLAQVPNVYNYIDAAHHGWIGWPANFGATATRLAEAARASGSTPANVWGFITNTANYSALSEPFININGTINGQQVKSAAWLSFNDYNDELTFAAAFRQQLISAGFNTGGGTDGIGMLIDTSRNGWGNCVQAPCPALPNRPTAASTSTDLNTNVNQSRIDRRIHKGNWCNQTGAGLGERPRANPATGIDAYVWIKPPGESDGSSRLIPNNEGKGWDQMCDERYLGNERNGNSASGALPDSPISGQWFPAQFSQLMANAFPAL